MSDDENDELRKVARQIRADPELAAFVPLSQAEREKQADAVLGRLEKGRLEKTKPFRRRAIPAIAAVFAAAAAVAALLIFRPDRAQPLEYALAIEGEAELRGANETPTIKVRPETRLVLKLTPARPERDLVLRVLIARNGRATTRDLPSKHDGRGTFEIDGRADALLGAQQDGEAELVIVLGRNLPDDAALERLALDPHAEPTSELSVLRRRLIFEGYSRGAIESLLGGCRGFIAGATPICELAPERPLRVWIGVELADAPAIALDGRTIDTIEPRESAHGVAFDFVPPENARILSIELAGAPLFTWTLARAQRPPKIVEAEQAMYAGELDRATRLLDEQPDELAVVRLRAKIARRKNDPAKERALREEAIARARSLGRSSDAVDETLAIVHGLLIDDHAIAEAARRLAAIEADVVGYAEGSLRRDYFLGLLASELGDLGGALAAFRRALVSAERLDSDGDRAMIHAPLADVLQSLGNNEAARTVAEAELTRATETADPCARSEALLNAAWLAREIDVERAGPIAAEAVEHARSSCPRVLQDALLNVGLFSASAGRVVEARAALRELGKAEGRVSNWAVRLDAEITLHEDAHRALDLAENLATRASNACSAELSYEAELLRARALAALDRDQEAVEAFAAAGGALDLWGSLVPLGEGREAFFARHEHLARTSIPFFLARAKADPAQRLPLAIAVRRSLARFVASLAAGSRARTRAELSASKEPVDKTSCAARRAPEIDQGAPVHPTLLVHPLPRGWLAIVWNGAEIEPYELEVTDRAALAKKIAAATAPSLAGAHRVHLQLHRALGDLALDRALLDAGVGPVVAFTADTLQPAPPSLWAPRTAAGLKGDEPGRSSRPAASCEGNKRALLIIDPRDNLRGARSTAEPLRILFESRGFAVDVLRGAAATEDAVKKAIAGACTELLHYDGHAIAESGDRDGDALALADGVLTAGEVLELPRVPPAVVLAGCSSAATEGLGLARAFLLAGARQVIGSTAPLADTDGAAFTRALYDESPDPLDLGARFAEVTQGSPTSLRVYER